MSSRSYSSCLSHSFTRQPLLLVSLDGLRPEYLQSWHTLLPVLDKLSESRPENTFIATVSLFVCFYRFVFFDDEPPLSSF